MSKEKSPENQGLKLRENIVVRGGLSPMEYRRSLGIA